MYNFPHRPVIAWLCGVLIYLDGVVYGLAMPILIMPDYSLYCRIIIGRSALKINNLVSV